MKELLRSNDWVRLSFLQALLRDAGIECLVFDQYTSILEGNIGAIPRRLVVAEDDAAQARRIIAEAECQAPNDVGGSRSPGWGGTVRMSEDIPQSCGDDADFQEEALLAEAAGIVTQDGLLGGRLLLRQPAEGYRVAIDPVLLAASIEAGPGDSVLDIGAGVGGATLCLATRLPAVRVIGLELQRDLVRLAGENAALNGLAGRASVMVGDLLRPPPRLSPGTYAHVMANPPYMPARGGTGSPIPLRAVANQEGEAGLADWIRFGLVMVRPRGTLTFVHRADRLDALLAELHGRAGDIVVYPLWPGAGKPARRVLVRARRDVKGPLRLAPGLVLHGLDGRFTADAEAILRDGAALQI